VRSPGAMLRLLYAFRRLGWHKFHDYEELSSASGISLSTVKRLIAVLEQSNYLFRRYDPDNPRRRLFRPSKNTVTFTDGYVTYTFSVGLFGDVDVEVSFPDN